jgi:hypothetical protein
MTEQQKEERRLKEILLDMLYATYFSHGTDGHNARIILAAQAVQLGYSITLGANMLILWKDGVGVLGLSEVSDDKKS